MKVGLKIKKKDLYMLLLLLPIFEPYAMQVLAPSIHRIFLLLKIISSAIIIFLYIYKPSGYMSKSLIAWGIYFLYLIANTLYQGRITNNFLINSISMFALIVFINLNIKEPKRLIGYFMLIAELLVYSNYFSMLAYPNGLYVSASTGNTENWLLGYDNFFEVTFVPAMIIALLYAYLNRKYFRAILLIAVIHLSATVTMPGTLVFCLAFIDVLYFLGIYRLKKVFNANTIVAVLVILSVGIVILNIQSSFGAFLFEWLGKDVTFTGRVYIWELSLLQIAQRPIIGYGFSDGDFRLAKMQNLMRGAFNCHNQYLEFLWEGGVILLIIFAICTMCVLHKVSESKEIRTSQIFTIGIASFFVMFIVKAHIQMCPPFFFVLWELAYYTKEIEASKINKPNIVRIRLNA